MLALVNSAADTWFRYMTSASVQATLLALVFLGTVWAGRRWSPAMRHALLMVALLKFVVPPTLSLPTGLFSRLRPNPVAESAQTIPRLPPVIEGALWPAEDATARLVETPVTGPKAAVEPALAVTPGVRHSLTVKGWLMMIHLAGALLVLGLVVLQKSRLRRLAQRANPVADTGICEAHDELCRRLRPHRRPKLLISKANHAPMTFGAWTPVVVLPENLVEVLPNSEVRVILAHELAHHRRRDLWLNLVQIPISALWWFNPIYWLLARRIRSVREDCCDDLVVASGLTSGEGYCRTLLQAARVASGQALAGAALAYIGESQPLHRRFQRIMSAHFITTPKLARTGILMVAALGMLLLPGVAPRAFNHALAGVGFDAAGSAAVSASAPAVTAPVAPASPAQPSAAPAGSQQGSAAAAVGPQTRLVGRVLDAETKLPIQSFSVSTSWQFAFGEWRNFQLAALGNEGRFTITLDDERTKYGIRVEADGYLPDSSHVVDTGKGDESLECALIRGDGPSGIVLLPDGAPAAGAKVWLFGGRQVSFNGVVGATTLTSGNPITSITMEGPDQFRNSSKAYRSTAGVTADSAGRFSFSPMADAHTIVAAHEQGLAVASVEQLTSSRTLNLEPWGRIEGVLWIGNQPGARQTLKLTRATTQKALNPLPANFNLELIAQTDAQGTFVFPQVPAGMQQLAYVMNYYSEDRTAAARVSLSTDSTVGARGIIDGVKVAVMLDPHAAINIETQVRPVFVKAGERTTIKIGGTGCPLIGRIVVTGAESPIDWNSPDIYHQLALLMPATPRPATQEAADAWLQSEEFRNVYQSRRLYHFAIAPDGSFRVDDLPAGTYRLNILIRGPMPQMIYDPAWPDVNPVLPTPQATFGSIVKEFTIPEMPGGRSDVPFDTGIITLPITRKH